MVLSITVGCQPLYVEMSPYVGSDSPLAVLQMTPYRCRMSFLPYEATKPSRDVMNTVVHISLEHHRRVCRDVVPRRDIPDVVCWNKWPTALPRKFSA